MLKRKLFRDLWQNKTQFISIFLMAFLGLFVFGGIDAESNGIGISVDRYYKNTTLADYWIMGESFSSDEVIKLEALPQVESVDRKLVLEGKAKMNQDTELDMELNFLESVQSSCPYLIEGELFSTDKKGIWVEELFAKAWNLQKGDYINLKYEGTEFQTQIQGIIIHPEYIFYTLTSDSMMPTYGKYGYAFLSADEFPVPDSLTFNRLVIKMKDDVDLSVIEAKELFKETLNREDVVILDKMQNTGIETIASEKEQHETMGIMFSVVFLLIAVMGIVTTMTRMTTNQRIQIGTLKALGFSKAKITWHYVSYGMVIGAAGSILGAVTGCLYLPLLFLPSMSAYYIIPEWIMQTSWKTYAAVLLAVFISALVSFLSCRKELKDMPAITLKPASPGKMKHSMLEKSKYWLSMGFSTQWNIRDILRNKARSIMGVVGVAGCTMLIFCAFGMKDSCAEMIVWQYGQLITGQQKVIFGADTGATQKREYAQQYSGQLVEEGTCEFKAEGKIKTGAITILDRGNYMHYQDKTGEEISIPKNGIALSVKMAKTLGVKQGDMLEWHIVGEKKWEKCRVSVLYRTPTGQGITMSKEMFEDLSYDFEPTCFYTNMSIPEYVKERDEIEGVISIGQLKTDLDESMGMVILMVVILVIAAVVLGVIVLYNMGVLSFMEKTREIATLKVLGFDAQRIRKLLQQQNKWITFIGIIFGLILGYLMLDAMMQTMSEDNDIPTVVYFMTYIYSCIGTWIVSTGVNRMLSGKIRTICMVDALKGVE